MNTVHSVTELMTAAARALQERNTDELFVLMSVVQSWLQTEEERNAQMELLETMAEACEELAALEEDLAVEQFSPSLYADDE